MNQVMGLDIDITGKDIIIIEDIIDTGLTIGYLAEEMKLYSPASIKTVALFSKPEAILTPVPIDYKGIEIQNRFIVGYGMDYNGLGRHLDSVYVVK